MDHSGLGAEETKAIKHRNSSASRSGLLDTMYHVLATRSGEQMTLVNDMGFGWGLAIGRELRYDDNRQRYHGVVTCLEHS